MEEAPLIIGGRDVAAKNAATFARKNPISGEDATRAAAASVEDAKAAADAAGAAFPKWAALGRAIANQSDAITNPPADIAFHAAETVPRPGYRYPAPGYRYPHLAIVISRRDIAIPQ